MELIIAFDNGVTGTVTFNFNDEWYFMKTPVREVANYQKKGKNINRIDIKKLSLKFIELFQNREDISNIDIYIERPFTNKSAIYSNAVASGMRAHEAIEIFCDMITDWKYKSIVNRHYVDSKEWQLFYNICGTHLHTKPLSEKKGIELFPQLSEQISRHGDADSLLMANYFYQKRLTISQNNVI